MDFSVPKELEAKIDELISRYPEKRSVTLMGLHALQEHFGYISDAAIKWLAQKLSLLPIRVLELVTFYPMFSQVPLGKYHFRICRTLSCELAGSHQIYEALCERLGLDKKAHGRQTTPDGLFTVEYVECLASCNTAPVFFLNEDFYENGTEESVLELVKPIETRTAKENGRNEDEK